MNLTCRKDSSNLIIRKSSEDMPPLRDTCLSVSLQPMILQAAIREVVMNANGELIGLAFDGNWEAMSMDLAFEPELQRTIAVDIRYVLWIMDVYAGAGHLVNEMKVVR